MSKVIRIGELPVAKVLTNQDLLVVNSFVEDRTYSITWGDLISNITEINQPVFFSRGSETRPSIAFVDFNAGFYSPGPSAVAITTSGTTRMSFDGDGNIDIGTSCEEGTVVFHSPTTFSCDSKFNEDILIDGNVIIQGSVQINGELDFVGTVGVVIEGNLTAAGDVVIGNANNGCAGTFFEVFSRSTYYCNTLFEQTLTVEKDITIGETTTTGNLKVLGLSEFQEEVTITDDVDINGTIFLDASEGRVDISGNLDVGGVISGDGAGITNLNIPGSLRFKGRIDLTIPPPANPQTGDLYITDEGPGTVNNSFAGIGGQTFQRNQFVFYTVDNVWGFGSVQESSGFVTLSGDQTVTGVKTFTSVLNASAGISAIGQSIIADSLTLTNKAVSASTSRLDNDKTLTTKDYVDDRSLNAVADFPLTLGNYISGNPDDLYDGAVAVTANIEGTPNNTANWLVARDADGNFSANIITADLVGRADISNKVDVKVANTYSNKTYPLFVKNGVTGSRNVHADTGFSYIPSSNTLTLTRVVADITGNVTGNTDTATALETPRNLWGKIFDGTANVLGNMSNVGNIIPQPNKNIGSASKVWANIYATTFHGYLNGNASVAERTKEKITAGAHILSTNGVTQFNGSEATTWYIDTSSDNTPGKIVVRNGSGSFSSNVITANEFIGSLTGDVTGNVSGSSSTCTGNAATATALQTPRTLWGQVFDGTSDVQGSLIDTGDVVPSINSAYNLGSSSLKFDRIYVNTIIGSIEGNSGSADKVNRALKRGDYISGGPLNFDGSVPGTWDIDATPDNTPNFIVARDGNGDFEAGTITASFVGPLTGDVTGDVSGSSSTCTGNAATATALEKTRKLWGRNFDGTADVKGGIANTGNIIPSQTLTYTIGKEDLRYSDIHATTFHGDLNGIADTANKVNHSLIRGAYLKGTYDSFDGSLNDTWDVDATPTNISNKIVARDQNGNFAANIITANEFVGDLVGNVNGNIYGSSTSCTGNAATATKLETERRVEVQVTGATLGSGFAMFDGTKDIEILIPTQGIVDLSILDPLPD